MTAIILIVGVHNLHKQAFLCSVYPITMPGNQCYIPQTGPFLAGSFRSHILRRVWTIKPFILSCYAGASLRLVWIQLIELNYRPTD